MAVTVRVGGPLRGLLGGRREVTADGATVRDVFDGMDVRERLCGDDGFLAKYVSVHVNSGPDVRVQDGLDTTVSDGDVITILTAVGGGQDDSR